jgi:hypothetical protein
MSLPVVDQISIASPCTVSWDSMAGDARSRFCGQCEKNVYDLTNMTRAEVEALVIAKEGKFCARFWKRRDGTLLTADCPAGLARVRRRMLLIAASLVALLGTVAGAAFGARRPKQCATQGTTPLGRWVHTAMGQPTPQMPMGLVAMPVPIATPAPVHPVKAKGSKPRHP